MLLCSAGMTFTEAPVAAQQVDGPRADAGLLWGDAVPDDWNGDWPEDLLTVPEKTDFKRTTDVRHLHEFIEALKWRTEHMHVLSVFTSPHGNVAPAVVMANPRITSAQEARESGKPVVFLYGNIHPPESEGAEALQMVMRDILAGDKGHLLDNQIVIVMPVLNVDGTEIIGTRDNEPHIHGTRTNSQGLDLNRDGVKLETVEIRGLFENILNPWDPVLIYDAHRMGVGNYAYSIAYVNSTVPAAHRAPRDYTRNVLFPAVRDAVRENFRMESFTHALWDRDSTWPPTNWHHDNTIWAVEAKFVANGYGLRNRMSILTETPGAAGFERQIYGQYAYIHSLLEFTNQNGGEMLRVARAADEEVVNQVLANAESGELRNWVDGEYRSRGTIDVLAWPEHFPNPATEPIPGTSVDRTVPVSGPPLIVSGVDDTTLPVGTKDAWVPRGYILPPELGHLAENLRIQNVQVEVLEAPMRVEGEQYMVDRMWHDFRGGYDMTVLDGVFAGPTVREFPAGSFHVDMAQPMANVAFYLMEPQARDGWVGWRVLDEDLLALGVNERTIVYPIFKIRRVLE
ncbi:MAG: M14 family metallopeptidase [Gemmatimonadota bacterium]